MPVGRWKQGNSREATHLPSCAGCNWAHTALAGWPAAKAAGFFSCLQTRKKARFHSRRVLPPSSSPAALLPLKAQNAEAAENILPCLQTRKSQISFEAGLAPLELPCSSVAAQSAKHRSCGKHLSLSSDKKKAGIHSRREKWCHALTISRCRAYHSCGGTRRVPNPTQTKGEHHAPLPE